MDIEKIHYVLCIAKNQNLTKAAQELYVSQPTLSKYLQRLESELDGKLFSRSGNCYIPTHLGKRYINYAKKMLSVQQEWEKELSDLNSCKEGELNIAFPLMRSSCMIPRIVPIFHKQYPGIQVNFYEETYAIQEKLLLDDQLDFAIFNEAIPHPKLTYEILLNEEIVLLLPPDHPLTTCGQKREGCRHPWMDITLLEEEPFIMNFSDQTTGKKSMELFQRYGMHPNIPFRTRNPQVCAKLSQQGLGACLIPENYVKNMNFEKEPICFSVGEKGIFSTLTIAYRKGVYLPSYAEDFIKIAKENV